MIRRRRAGARRAVLAVGLAAVLAMAAACGGGSSDSDADAATTSAPITATDEDATTSAPTEVSPRATELATMLPDEDAVADLGSGTLTELGDPEELVDQLYREGDPSRDAAVERFRDGGYDLGVLRDQVSFAGDDVGPRLVRTYVVGFATPGAAQAEVGASVEEVKQASSAPSTDVPVDGVPGAQAVSLELPGDAGELGEALFVTFAADRFLFGIQSLAEAGAGDVLREEVLQAARDTYDAAS